ncbi:DUF3144 domain-containing protein [Zhouia sp. PK063]|uniref:DUF3144 domain-containing protein n=1 Tax=Zhouia sp. PK063 TaxID=3373602 RepID=UPI0037A4D6F5
MNKIDDTFFDRADEHIHIANEHLNTIDRGKVSASFMYSLARFNAWVSACNYTTGEAMEKDREEVLAYFTAQYRKMLDDNFSDYANNFPAYMHTNEE